MTHEELLEQSTLLFDNKNASAKEHYDLALKMFDCGDYKSPFLENMVVHFLLAILAKYPEANEGFLSKFAKMDDTNFYYSMLIMATNITESNFMWDQKEIFFKFTCELLDRYSDRINTLPFYFHSAIACIALNLAQENQPVEATTLLTKLFKTWHKDAGNKTLPTLAVLPELNQNQTIETGTFGTVEIHPHQAIKRIKENKKLLTDNADVLFSFVVELFTLTLLQNQQYFVNIQNLSLNSRFAIVMNNAGCNLSKYWQQYNEKQQTIPLKIQLLIIIQILKGVDTLHNMGILHRDLKGGNIFIDGAHNISIGDMGTAITVEQITQNTQQALNIATTYDYASDETIMLELSIKYFDAVSEQLVKLYCQKFNPEISTPPLYSKSSDVYSIGRIWYELAFLRFPFNGTSTVSSHAIKIANNNNQVCTFKEFSDNTNAVCANNVFNLWKTVPAERPSTREVIDNLEKEYNKLN